MSAPELTIEEFASPVGGILLVSKPEAVLALDFEDFEERMRHLLEAHHGEVQLRRPSKASQFRRALESYFEGKLEAIEPIPVESGGTPFQRKVWSALRTIPAGTTLTYGGLGKRIGRPSASRAVGLANSQNPVAIVQPCHRVVGASSSLTGYAGGLNRKRWLLEHEGVRLKSEEPSGRRGRSD